MGGSSYDRDVYSSSSSSGWTSSSFGASSVSTSKLSKSVIDPTMAPNRKIIRSTAKNPIIVVLDVTGSNIDFAKVVYDKMPMFYGQIEQQKYFTDFDISFCAVGDAYTDSYPLQIADFAKGIELDSWLEKLVLESGGGGQMMESYELMAYYLYKNTEFAPGSEPLIFFIGDEKPYPTVNRKQAEQFEIECGEDNIKPFPLLCEKVHDNVFMLLNKYCSRSFRDDITKAWTDVMPPEHVIRINEEKSIVDLMLGVIAMVSTTRTLDSYVLDMGTRGQTPERIRSVSESLQSLSTSLVPVEVTGDIIPTSGKKTGNAGKRL